MGTGVSETGTSKTAPDGHSTIRAATRFYYTAATIPDKSPREWCLPDRTAIRPMARLRPDEEGFARIDGGAN